MTETVSFYDISYLVTHCFPLYYFRLVASISMTSVVAFKTRLFPKASAKLIPFSEPTKHFSIFFTTIFTPSHPTPHRSTTYTAKKISPHRPQQRRAPSRNSPLYIMYRKMLLISFRRERRRKHRRFAAFVATFSFGLHCRSIVLVSILSSRSLVGSGFLLRFFVVVAQNLIGARCP